MGVSAHWLNPLVSHTSNHRELSRHVVELFKEIGRVAISTNRPLTDVSLPTRSLGLGLALTLIFTLTLLASTCRVPPLIYTSKLHLHLVLGLLFFGQVFFFLARPIFDLFSFTAFLELLLVAFDLLFSFLGLNRIFKFSTKAAFLPFQKLLIC